MRELVLSAGKVALLDEADFEWAAQFKWSYAPCRGGGKPGYGLRMKPDGKFEYLHRAVADRALGPADSKLVVDHINGNSLDNQRSNLRRCTRGENLRSRGKPNYGKNKYKGVSWNGNRWHAYADKGGRRHTIGYFCSEEEAVQARDAFAVELHGAFHWPSKTPDSPPAEDTGAASPPSPASPLPA